MAIAKPTIHLNGTSRESLLESYMAAGDAITVAIQQLIQAAPNGRDYYPQGDGALREAMRQHEERIASLRKVMEELQEIAEAIAA